MPNPVSARSVFIRGILAAVSIHVLGPLVARQFAFSGLYLLLATLLVYTWVASMIARALTWNLGLLAAFGTAAADLAIGTPLWWWLDPVGRPEMGLTVTFVAYSIVGGTVLALLGGALGAFLGARMKTRRPGPTSAAP